MAKVKKTDENDDIYEIVSGIYKAVSLAYDGPTYNEDEDNKIGLRREEGNPLLDVRILDGFGVKVSGRKLTINYHAEIPLDEISRQGPEKFENEIEDTIEKCLKFVKKNYKQSTGKTLGTKELKVTNRKGREEKDFNVLIQSISRVRTSVTAQKSYELLGIPKEEEPAKSEIIAQYEKYNKAAFSKKKKAEAKPKRIA
jgi:hypothetical protein